MGTACCGVMQNQAQDHISTGPHGDVRCNCVLRHPPPLTCAASGAVMTLSSEQGCLDPARVSIVGITVQSWGEKRDGLTLLRFSSSTYPVKQTNTCVARLVEVPPGVVGNGFPGTSSQPLQRRLLFVSVLPTTAALVLYCAVGLYVHTYTLMACYVALGSGTSLQPSLARASHHL